MADDFDSHVGAVLAEYQEDRKVESTSAPSTTTSAAATAAAASAAVAVDADASATKIDDDDDVDSSAETIEQLRRAIEQLLDPKSAASDATLDSQRFDGGFVSVEALRDCRIISEISRDATLIAEAIARSATLELDDSQVLVRFNDGTAPTGADRTRLVLRNLPLDASEEEVRGIFSEMPSPAPRILRAERVMDVPSETVLEDSSVAGTWFVHFSNEEECLRAHEFLQSRHERERDISARVTEAPPAVEPKELDPKAPEFEYTGRKRKAETGGDTTKSSRGGRRGFEAAAVASALADPPMVSFTKPDDFSTQYEQDSYDYADRASLHLYEQSDFESALKKVLDSDEPTMPWSMAAMDRSVVTDDFLPAMCTIPSDEEGDYMSDGGLFEDMPGVTHHGRGGGRRGRGRGGGGRRGRGGGGRYRDEYREEFDDFGYGGGYYGPPDDYDDGYYPPREESGRRGGGGRRGRGGRRRASPPADRDTRGRRSGDESGDGGGRRRRKRRSDKGGSAPPESSMSPKPKPRSKRGRSGRGGRGADGGSRPAESSSPAPKGSRSGRKKRSGKRGGDGADKSDADGSRDGSRSRKKYRQRKKKGSSPSPVRSKSKKKSSSTKSKKTASKKKTASAKKTRSAKPRKVYRRKVPKTSPPAEDGKGHSPADAASPPVDVAA